MASPGLHNERRLLAPRSGRSFAAIPIVVLVIGLVGCGLLLRKAFRDREQADADAFERLITNAESDLRQRFAMYVEALHGAAGFFRASTRVDRSEWREFTATLDIHGRYPGIRGIGLIFPVAETDLEPFVQSVRTEVPGFNVRSVAGPQVKAEERAIITFHEPLSQNSEALGVDVYSEPNRREAAQEARDYAEPRVTRRVELVQDGQHRPGAMIFVPVYRRGTVPVTLEDRRACHVAWVYAPFVYEELFRGVMGRRQHKVELELFEGAGTRPEDSLYRSNPEGGGFPVERIGQFELGGRMYSFAWSRGAAFVKTPLPPLAWTALSAGLATALLAGLMWSVQGTSRRARELADELTREMAEAQRELEVSQKLLQTVTGILPGMVAYWTADLRCAFSNSEYLDWFGKTAQQMNGIRMQDLLGDVLFQKNEPYVRGVLKGEPQRFERQLTKQNGQVCHTWAQYIPHFAPGGKTVIGFVVLVSDVTEVMRQQDALRESEARLRISLKEVTDLKTALDAHAIVAITDADGRITYANEKFCEVSDYRRDEIIGRTHSVVNSRTHSREFFEQMWATISAGRIWRGEICNRKKGGALYWVDTTIVPFMGENGRPFQYIAIRTDITYRIELEQSLAIARDQALESSRLKSEFLATMSHEIRTPMNAIIGMAGLLSDTPMNAEQSEMLRIVTGAAESLLTIINDILDFSRIEAGQLRLDIAEFDLERVTRETVSLLGPKAREKHIDLLLELQPPPTSHVLGDAGRVRQVLLNLIGNAVKFTDDGRVKVKVAVLGESDGQVKVRVDVEDSGVGIPDDARDRLFKPFVQVDGSPTRRFGGTGLGLAITQQLITAMGGSIRFESQLGRGSTFTFELAFDRGRPLSERNSVVENIAAPVGNGDNGSLSDQNQIQPAGALPHTASVPELRLLLVEDNVANQQVATRLLRKIGHSVDVVSNGHLALERLAANPYDAVLMDCQMPLLDGYETTRWIRSGSVPGVNPAIPVIALTAYARDEDRHNCEAAGMDAYVSKPIRISELKAVLDGVKKPGCLPRNPLAAREDGVLDADVVETARSLPGIHGPSLLPELVELYLKEEPCRLAEIQRLIGLRSETAAADLHSFGGNAASFGGAEVRRVAIQIEQLIRAGNWDEAERRHASLLEACERLRAAARGLAAKP